MGGRKTIKEDTGNKKMDAANKINGIYMYFRQIKYGYIDPLPALIQYKKHGLLEGQAYAHDYVRLGTPQVKSMPFVYSKRAAFICSVRTAVCKRLKSTRYKTIDDRMTLHVHTPHAFNKNQNVFFLFGSCALL